MPCPNVEPQPPADPEADFNPFQVNIALALPHTIRHLGVQTDVQLESSEGMSNLLFKIVGKHEQSANTGLDLVNIICQRID